MTSYQELSGRAAGAGGAGAVGAAVLRHYQADRALQAWLQLLIPGMVCPRAPAGWAAGSWAAVIWQATRSFLDGLLVQLQLELAAQPRSDTIKLMEALRVCFTY